MKEKNNIILVGDIHGEFSTLGYNIKKFHEDSCIVQLGDFGIGFYRDGYYKNELTHLNKILKSKNCHLYAIRGNHDSPKWFKETNNPFNLSNITFLADYSELTLLQKNFLFVGGAVSVDRSFRKEGISYWNDEEFNLKLDNEFPYSEKQYDVVVTHTRPGVCGAFKGFDKINYWCDQDYDLREDLILESQKVDYLYEKTKPKYWIFGHFHESLRLTYEKTEFRCLNIHEHWELPID